MRGWLRQILLNNLHDLRERYRTEKRQIGREALPAGELQGAMPSPSEEAIRNEQTLALESALSKLPAETRELIELRNRDGWSFANIAARLQISEHAVRKRWARAIEALRQAMSDDSSHK